MNSAALEIVPALPATIPKVLVPSHKDIEAKPPVELLGLEVL